MRFLSCVFKPCTHTGSFYLPLHWVATLHPGIFSANANFAVWKGLVLLLISLVFHTR